MEGVPGFKTGIVLLYGAEKRVCEGSLVKATNYVY